MSSGEARAPELRVTLAVGAAFVVQTALGLIWAGAAAERLGQLERRADASGEIIERTARLEEQVAAVRASLSRIEARLDRLSTENE
jgi:ubiquinone biosynthesis protein UbiJ